jgi:hypothetical protein
MNELVNLIIKKTGIPEATAITIVKVVSDYVSKKLPGPIGAQVKALLSNDAAVSKAESIIGGLASSIRKKTPGKKG